MVEKAAASTKRCTRCGNTKAVGEFYAQKNHKDGKHSWCKVCFSDYIQQRARKRRASDKEAVFDFYGGRCACCRESNPVFLTMDHVDGGGNARRREGKGQHDIYHYLVKQGFPPGFRILCMNCNWAMHVTKGNCPHRSR